MLRTLTLTLIICIAACASGQTLVDVQQLIVDGDYTGAISRLETLGDKEKKNATVDQLKGECLVALGKDAEAIEAFKASHKKGNNDALLSLMEIAIREYRIADADQLLETYRKGLKKGRKTLPDESAAIVDRLDRTRNMLDRVEKIIIIDSMIVDTDEFFRHYRLSSGCGSLNSPAILPDNFEAAAPTVVYEPESRREMIWAAPDSTENYQLYSSSALYGGEWEPQQPLGDVLGDGGDANYPFLMPDGITLYFANNGDNSLGGYDIYISRRDGTRFLQPQNLGMPYNSPYDDYMLAIDETTGVGWWATDRNRIEDKLTIYLFIPSDMRINVPVDAPDLANRARIRSIRDTWEPDADYSSLIERVAGILPSGTDKKEQFRFALPGGRIYTRLDNFRNPDARIAMRRYLDTEKSIAETRTRLAQLRGKYAGGDTSVASEIRDIERQLLGSGNALRQLSNEIIRYETR